MKNKLYILLITTLFSTGIFANENHSLSYLYKSKIEKGDIIVTNPPTGNATQTFCAGATLSSIQVTGTNIKWYGTASSLNVLPNTTLLFNNTSYYASQTVGGVESVSRLVVVVHITPAPILNTNLTPYELCDNNNSGNGIEVFNLSTKTAEIINGQSSMTVSYYLNQTNATNQTNPLPNLYSNSIANSQTIWYAIKNTVTGCISVGSLNLVVHPLPVALSFYPQFETCEVDAPVGYETFDLTTKIPAILLGQTGVSVTFYPSILDATNNANAITNPSAYTNTQANAQTIGIRLTNVTTGCYTISSMDLVINPKPQPTLPTQPYVVCDDNQDGISSFNLNTITPDLLQGAPEVYTISYYLNSSDAETGNNSIDLSVPFINSNSPFQQFLWVRAENQVTHCFTVIQIVLDVDPAPIMPTNLSSIVFCDNDNNPYDGCTTFNLSSQTPVVLAAQSLSASNFFVSYYTSQTDASATESMNQILDPFNYYSCGNTTIWVRVENATTHCFSVGSFHIIAIPSPIDPIVTLVGNVLYSNAPAGNQWYDQNGVIVGAMGTSFTLPSSGVYGCQVQNGDCWSNIVYNNYTLGTESFIESNFSLFPNPTSDRITVLVPTSLLNNSVSYAISDVLGKTILDGELLAESTTINISHLEDGVYFILFRNKDKQIVKKILKR